MRLEDSFHINTFVEVALRGSDGHLTEFRPLGHNTITHLGRANMAHLFAGDDVANRSVHEFRFGDGGHVPSNPVLAVPTAAVDTDLYGDTIITKLVSYNFPDGASAGKVAFECEISANEGNGTGSQPYSEVGLFDTQGRMLAHKAFGLITKSEAIGLAFRYSFLF